MLSEVAGSQRPGQLDLSQSRQRHWAGSGEPCRDRPCGPWRLRLQTSEFWQSQPLPPGLWLLWEEGAESGANILEAKLNSAQTQPTHTSKGQGTLVSKLHATLTMMLPDHAAGQSCPILGSEMLARLSPVSPQKPSAPLLRDQQRCPIPLTHLPPPHPPEACVAKPLVN